MLSNTCKYAIRAVLFLALNESENNKIGIKRISESLKMPSPFLGKILQVLARHKILSSTKGPHGGFSLSKKAEDITLLEIVKIIDGLDFFNTCIIGVKVCEGDTSRKDICPFHDKLDPLRDELFNQFRNLTIGTFKNDLAAYEGLISL
jgi:Rrf2 family transcriptional regulator, iron-sulfur cluster assembly transcription factor